MSKIEKYKEAKRIAKNIMRDVSQCLGTDNHNNDKARIYVKFCGLANEDWTPMKFTIHASHGYYGSSSAYSDASNELGEFLALAITEQSKSLFERAVQIAEEDAESARIAAIKEAEEVLYQTSE